MLLFVFCNKWCECRKNISSQLRKTRNSHVGSLLPKVLRASGGHLATRVPQVVQGHLFFVVRNPNFRADFVILKICFKNSLFQKYFNTSNISSVLYQTFIENLYFPTR